MAYTMAVLTATSSSTCTLRASQLLFKPMRTAVIQWRYPRIQSYHWKPPHPQQRRPDSFQFSEMKVSLATPEVLKPKPSAKELVFGKCFTDHMLEVEWDKARGWETPRICPFHNISMHPAAKVLHYAIEVYEGMKAFRGVDSQIRLFRPESNMKRFLSGARRAMLPEFDPVELLRCIKELIRIDSDWVPSSECASLYVRPALIGTEASLGLAQSSKALLYVITCPVGPYFANGFKAVGLLADPHYTRSWPGGCGELKLGSNYGPTVYLLRKAEEAGLQQVLWLYGDKHLLTEAGTMNIFLLIANSKGDKELITPPADGLILPGITRQSVLEICRQWNEFRVTERCVSMEEVSQLCQEKRLLEFFGAGTACTICPVDRISYIGVNYHIPTLEHAEPLCIRLLNEFNAIYYGSVSHEWSVVLE